MITCLKSSNNFNNEINSENKFPRSGMVKKFEKPLTCRFVKNQCYLKVIVYEEEATVI